MTDDGNHHRYLRWLEDLGNGDVALVGGKNASLGELIGNLRHEGVRVPPGFATTADAYREFLHYNQLDEFLARQMDDLAAGKRDLASAGSRIRRAMRRGELPAPMAEAIRAAYGELCRRSGRDEIAVAVRSSATAEDLPEASFAGQQETYLNVTGSEELLSACRDCFASLFTDRAISYRENHGFDHLSVALSVGVQQMVRSDRAGAGVMFSLDTDSGFPDVVVIDAAWGLGETVVQGSVDPDEYRVFKPRLNEPELEPILAKSLGSKEKMLVYATGGKATTRSKSTPRADRQRFVLDDPEILTLARWAVAIERHYGCPMDMEWAKDGETGELYCVQARPETVHGARHGGALRSYRLQGDGDVAVTGVAIGEAIATGRARLLNRPSEMKRFEDGDVLVTERTDPDWGPVMRRAAAIVTDHGGRTSHAAIVSRELGVPAVVGCDDATRRLADGEVVTVSCAEGSMGRVYRGALDFDVREIEPGDLPEAPVQLMINLAAPDAALRWWRLPVQGVGLARMEFIINEVIKVHPMALARFDELQDAEAKARIEALTAAYASREAYFVEQLARGIATIAASQYPHPAIVRMSDFKSNEYAQLIGGSQFEPAEENPMLGFRGASRYYSERYEPGFALECAAVKRAREVLGLDNIVVMIPFVRTPAEADRVIEVLRRHGLRRGEAGLQLYMMTEVPSNVILADRFAERFDGFSIGSNDLTQLVLGVDRDSDVLAELFDERDEAVQRAIVQAIDAAHRAGCKVGICGQAPSDHDDFARFLVEAGIDSMSLNPDSVIEVLERLGQRGSPEPGGRSA